MKTALGNVEIDLGAERLIGAERQGQKILRPEIHRIQQPKPYHHMDRVSHYNKIVTEVITNIYQRFTKSAGEVE